MDNHYFHYGKWVLTFLKFEILPELPEIGQAKFKNSRQNSWQDGNFGDFSSVQTYNRLVKTRKMKKMEKIEGENKQIDGKGTMGEEGINNNSESGN